MATLNKFWTFVIGVVIVLICLGFIGLIGWGFTAVILNGEVSSIATLVGAVLVAMASIITILVTKSKDRQLKYMEMQNKYKEKVYTEIINTFATETIKIKDPDERGRYLSSQEFMSKFYSINEKLILWASPKVIRAYGRIRQKQTDPLHTLLVFEDIYLAMREDVGIDNKELKPTNVMSIFINDIQFME